MFDSPQRRPIYATAGEQVTCEHGHVICDFRRDGLCGEPFDPSRLLGNWRQPEPASGDANVVCAICQTPFYDGLALHFADGYRYADPAFSGSPGRSGDIRPGLGARFNHGSV